MHTWCQCLNHNRALCLTTHTHAVSGPSPLDIVLEDLEQINTHQIDCSLYLLSRGFGSPKNKIQLLYGACSLGKLEVVTELVERHKVVGEFIFPSSKGQDLHTTCTDLSCLIVARARAVVQHHDSAILHTHTPCMQCLTQLLAEVPCKYNEGQ